MRLSELPEPAITPMLIGALSNENRAVRQCAAISLARRRSRVALDGLLAQYANEDVDALAVSVAVAIVASGPHSVADLQSTLAQYARNSALAVHSGDAITRCDVR